MKVVVIGAGIVGVSIADALARRGAAPVVLDMRAPGLGASRASAGILAPYIEGFGHEALTALAARSLDLYDEFVARLTEDTGRPIEYQRTGTLEAAMDETGVVRLRETRDWMSSRGVASEWFDAAGARALEPALSPSIAAALLTPAHGFVGVHALMAALVHRAKMTGAVFESPIEAVSVSDLGDRVDVRAGDRRYEADAAVIASGSWSGRVRVANVAALPVRPVRGQLLHLRLRGDRRPSRVIWGPRCYAVPWTDGSLLIGATVEDAGFDEHVTTAGVLALTSAATELLPDSRDAVVEDIRVGLRPALPDELPAIGPLARAPRVTMATGHFRNGVLLAPLTADVVARSILDGARDEIFSVTSPDRPIADASRIARSRDPHRR